MCPIARTSSVSTGRGDDSVRCATKGQGDVALLALENGDVPLRDTVARRNHVVIKEEFIVVVFLYDISEELALRSGAPSDVSAERTHVRP